MFELLRERLSHALTLKSFIARHIKKEAKKIKQDEKKFKQAEEKEIKEEQAGSIEGVKKYLEKEDKELKLSIEEVEKLEVNSFLLVQRVLVNYHKEIKELLKAFKDLINNNGIMNSVSKKEIEKVKKDLQVIAKFFEEESDLVRRILIRMSRVSKDIYEAMKNDNAKERLRDNILTIAGDFREGWKATFLKSKTRHEIKDQKKVLKNMEKLLDIIEGKVKQDVGKTFVKVLDDITKDLKKENSDLKTFMKNTQYIFLITMKHFFEVISYIKEVEKTEQRLISTKYPETIIKQIKKDFEEDIDKEEEELYKDMHLAYQEYHKEETLKRESNKIESEAREIIRRVA